MDGLAVTLGSIGAVGIIVGLTMALWYYLDYNTTDRWKKRAVTVLITASAILIVGAFYFGANKNCSDYNIRDYKYGDVPVKCQYSYKVGD